MRAFKRREFSSSVLSDKDDAKQEDALCPCDHRFSSHERCGCEFCDPVLHGSGRQWGGRNLPAPEVTARYRREILKLIRLLVSTLEDMNPRTSRLGDLPGRGTLKDDKE